MKRVRPDYYARSHKKSRTSVLLGTAVLAAALIGCSGRAEAAQPHSSYWYPNTLLEWSPASDRDAEFNRGTVKLQEKRVQGAKVNPNAKYESKVIALASMYPSTSGAPSQGSEKFNIYTFSYWQYVDKLVMWGGSAGEGLIVPPSADVIDAAHKNGVQVFGTVFLPQTEHGGKIEWMHDLLKQRADGSFPVADKLIEAATYYGFDGWFINQETQGASQEDAEKMQQFLIYLQNIKDPKMEMIWYDSMIKDGAVKWQGSVTDNNKMFVQDGAQRVSDGMFLDFRWQYKDEKNGKYDYITPYVNSPSVMKGLGRNPFDLYAGIDVEAKGYEDEFNWPILFPEGKDATTSLGIYRPDWAFNSSKTQEEFMEKDRNFWVGTNKNPQNMTQTSGVSPMAWRGIANDIVDKSVLTSSEMITHFNTGNGHMFAVNGKLVRDKDWSNRSLQDILPTWRFITEAEGSGKPLTAGFDFGTAYYGGSSLKLEGNLTPDSSTTIKLYKANMPVDASTEISVIYQDNADSSRVKIGIAFVDAPDQYIYLEPKKTEKAGQNKDWNKGSVSLKPYTGRTIVGLSLKFESSKPVPAYKVNVGELAVTKAEDQADHLQAVKLLNVTENDFRDGIYGDARLSWEAPEKAKDVLYYQVYRMHPDGEYELAGTTGNTVYYVPEMRRLDKEAETKLVVIPVNRYYEQGDPASVIFHWPKYPKPSVAFEVDKTLIAPGDTVQFTDFSSEVAETWNWSFPGGEPVSSSERNPKVTYKQEGTFEVTLTAKNSEGGDTVKKQLITVTGEAVGGVSNLALGKTVTASSFTNESEAPKSALDGDDKKKWCAVGDAPHTLTVDLGGEHKVSEFVIKHAEAGGEPAAFNTRAFKIQLSSDNQNWTDAVKVSDNIKGVSKHTIALASAGYVRLVVEQPTQGSDMAARIYEFEIIGLS